MISWLFKWHGRHRRAALLPAGALGTLCAFQLLTISRYDELLLPEPLGYLLAAVLVLLTLASLVVSLAHWLRECIERDSLAAAHDDEHAAVAEHLAFVIAEMGLMRRILEQRPPAVVARPAWDGGLNHRIVVPPRSTTVYGARQDVGSKDFLPETMEGIGFDDDTGSLALGSS